MTDGIYGGFWRRLVAYAIDKLILYLISLFLFLIAILALGLGGGSLNRIVTTGDILSGLGFVLVYFAATYLIEMLYFTLFHGSVGQTPGKMFLGLRVIRDSGEEMTFGLAFLRWVGTFVSGLFLNLGFLWIAIDGKKQGWHDKIAATLVVRVPSGPSPAPPSASGPRTDTAIAGQTPAAGAPAPADLPQGSGATDFLPPPVSS